MSASALRAAATTLFLIMALPLVSARVATAQDGLGPPFQVNTNTAEADYSPDVDSTPGGEFVVVWFRGGAYGTGVQGSVEAQRFDATGSPSGTQFQVNTDSLGSLGGGYPDPRIGLDDSGAALVVWRRSLFPQPFATLIAGQRYDASGSAVGDEFQISSDGQEPAVGVASDGAAMVVWSSDTSAGTDQGSKSIQARRYDSTGTAVGNAFQVNTTTTGDQRVPGVSIAPDGGAVVVWRDHSTSPTGVRGQRYDPSGAPTGTEFLVAAVAYRFDIAHTPSGGFIVVWSGGGQRYDASGTPVGSPMPGIIGSYPAVAVSPLGEFVVASTESDVSAVFFFVHGRRYDSSGTPPGEVFQIASNRSGGYKVDLSYDANDRYVVVWSAPGPEGGFEIFGRRSGFFAHLPAMGPAGLFVLVAAALLVGLRSLRTRNRITH